MCRSSLEASCSASNRTMWEEEVTLEIWRDFDRKWPKMWLLSTSGVFWEFLWPLLNLSLCTAAIVVLVWAWCHFPAPALTRKSPRQIPIVLLLQASVFSEGYFLLPKTCPERVGKLPSVRESKPHRCRAAISDGSPQHTSSETLSASLVWIVFFVYFSN